jgi:AbrB family looped-hinge helix DNA binding protein
MSKTIATTKMSSRGQIVIPETIRTQLGLTPGAQFVVLGQEDVVMLKLISPPTMKEYNELKGRLRQQAREAGLKRTDIEKTVKEVRNRKR